jgi:Fe-Mn family superoxide dismutase
MRQGELALALERDWQRRRLAPSSPLAPRPRPAVGLTLLTWSERHQRLLIQWAADHTNCLAGGLLVWRS